MAILEEAELQTSEEMVKFVERAKTPELVRVTALVPKALVLAAESVPFVMRVVPVKLLVPARTVVPEPN
jgi:hypothetical protein